MERVALVTGASRGIGRAVAARLAREGWAVTINYCSREREAQTLAEELRGLGCRVLPWQADVSDPAAVERMVAETAAAFGPVSLLVNNAGIAGQLLFQDTTAEQWRRFFAVNVDGAFHAIQAVLPAMLHRKTGCIVNLSSIWGLRGASCEVAYSATKAAVIGLTRSLALELALSGIRVNCVAPGVIDTDMCAALGDETRQELAEQTPLGRLGTAADVAGVVSFLAGADASFLTGQVLTADGGFIV